MGLSSHTYNYVELWTCFLFLAKLFWNYWVVCHRNWLTCLPYWTCLSNFYVNDSFVICKWGFPEETLFFNIEISSCAWESYVKEFQISDFVEFWLDLKICQVCYMPSTLWNSDRNSILDILFTFDVPVIWKVYHRTDTSKCLTQLHIVSLFALGPPFCLACSFAICSNFY